MEIERIQEMTMGVLAAGTLAMAAMSATTSVEWYEASTRAHDLAESYAGETEGVQAAINAESYETSGGIFALVAAGLAGTGAFAGAYTAHMAVVRRRQERALNNPE